MTEFVTKNPNSKVLYWYLYPYYNIFNKNLGPTVCYPKYCPFCNKELTIPTKLQRYFDRNHELGCLQKDHLFRWAKPYNDPTNTNYYLGTYWFLVDLVNDFVADQEGIKTDDPNDYYSCIVIHKFDNLTNYQTAIDIYKNKILKLKAFL
jgi:hypothetical protein